MLLVSYGGFWKNLLFYVAAVALFALGNLDFAFALVSFSLSGVWVLPVEHRVGMDFLGRLHYLVQQWIHVYGRLWSIFSLFYVGVDSNPEAFFSIWLNGEVCTVDASGCSLFSAACTSKSGHYFYKVCSIFAAQCGLFSVSSSELRPCQFMTVVLWTYTHS